MDNGCLRLFSFKWRYLTDLMMVGADRGVTLCESIFHNIYWHYCDWALFPSTLGLQRELSWSGLSYSTARPQLLLCCIVLSHCLAPTLAFPLKIAPTAQLLKYQPWTNTTKAKRPTNSLIIVCGFLRNWNDSKIMTMRIITMCICVCCWQVGTRFFRWESHLNISSELYTSTVQQQQRWC